MLEMFFYSCPTIGVRDKPHCGSTNNPRHRITVEEVGEIVFCKQCVTFCNVQAATGCKNQRFGRVCEMEL